MVMLTESTSLRNAPGGSATGGSPGGGELGFGGEGDGDRTSHGGGGGGLGGPPDGGGDGGGGGTPKPQWARRPQSWQSVHAVHVENSEPSPPSSQSPSPLKVHVLTQVPPPGGAGEGGGGQGGGGESTVMPPGAGGGGGGAGLLLCSQLPGSRSPQSAQSWHGVQLAYSEPSPPSSQSPSLAKMHVFRHVPLPGLQAKRHTLKPPDQPQKGQGAGGRMRLGCKGAVATIGSRTAYGPGGGGDGVIEGGGIAKAQLTRGPQSWQSVHAVHDENSEPSPPSSHSPSAAKLHELTHVPAPGLRAQKHQPTLGEQ